MKGKNKYIVPLLLAGLTTATGLVTTINPQQQAVVQAETSTEQSVAGLDLQLKGGFKDSYTLNTPITMPEVIVSGASGNVTLTYKITRGSKTIETITLGSTDSRESDEKKFTPKATGAYDVTITATEEGSNRVLSAIEDLKIVVSKTDASIKLPTNSKYVIPAQIPAEHETGLRIPKPEVVITGEDGEETTATSGLEVILFNSKGVEKTLTEVAGTAENGNVAYYQVTKDDIKDAGTYQIRYVYKEGDATITSLDTNFQVVKDLDISDIDLRMKLQSSVPSTGNVNTDISVPKVTVLPNKDATDGINAHITITYSKVLGNGQFGEPKEIDYDTYTFCPEEVGNYVLSYKVDLNELYTGVQSEPYNPSTIIKVTDNKEPSVRPTVNYTVTDGVVSVGDENVTKDNSNEKLPNIKYSVPSVVFVNEAFSLPAIYGEDNLSSYSNIKFSREIAGNNTVTKYYRSYENGTDTIYPANEAVQNITLTTAGNYEIRYRATDENGKTIKATYTLVVKERDDVSDSKFSIKMNVGVSTITNKETLSFSKPTASDTYDSELEVRTYYDLWTTKPETLGELSANGERDGYIANTRNELVDLKNGKYSIKVGDLESTAKYIRIYTVAKRDYSITEDNGYTTAIEKWVQINKINEDTTAPTFKISGEETTVAEKWNAQLLELNKDITIKNRGEDTVSVTKITDTGFAHGKYNSDSLEQNITYGSTDLAAFDQGKDIIKLPKVSFQDKDENLKIRVTIKDRNGNTVTKTDYGNISKSSVSDGWIYEISDVAFKLSSSGMYTVTYRAEDVAGNITVKTYGIRVNDKTAPTIVIENEDRFGGDVELGEFFEVPVGTLIKDGETLTDRDVTWQVYGGDVDRRSDGFYALEAGTYYVKYSGSDGIGNTQNLQDDSLFYINVKDTTAPVFNNEEGSLPSAKAWERDEDEEKVEEMRIDIPTLFATDPIRNQSVDVKVTITGPDGTVKVQLDSETEKNYFIAKKEGKYTIKYEATDDSKNTTTKTMELALGDCVAPKVEWLNNYSVPTKVDLNSDLVLNLSNMKLEDDETSPDKLKDNLTIKLIKPDGTTTVKNNGNEGLNYEWTLTETGSYTLNITVKDEAGNSETYKYTIEVPAEETDTKTISPVVGTVLIVVSVVILAGVVIYFVISSRKKAPVKPSRTKKK